MNASVLTASHYGVVRFGDLQCEAVVLKGGERGYVRRQLSKLLGFHEIHKGGRFARFLADFAPNSLSALEKTREPILLPSGRQAQFFPAGIIADVASAVVSAAINGTRQIGLAVLGCTATLMLAFLPLMALPAGSGAYIKSLPVTVLCTIAASLLVSMTIIPFLASRLLDKHSDPEGNPILQAVNGGIHRFYSPLLHRALARPWLALALMLALCVTTVPLLKVIGSSLFPPAETPQFLIRIETPDGSSLARTDRVLKFVENRLKAEPDVVWRAGNLGRGNPQIFYNQTQRESATTYAEVFVSLRKWEPGKSEVVLDRLLDLLLIGALRAGIEHAGAGILIW